ncbi:hypothetical protein U1769_13215 [Sphingomonas sp. ZT3P38]|uniref:hypothetical protein n=1 Tax=Parasphingomonas zepuensis TaxID=3096161 RepID=UPI002FC7565C
MGKPSVLTSIETTSATTEKCFGRDFMHTLIGQDSRLEPELVSTSERFKDPFISLDHFIEEWWAMPIKTHFDGRVTGERFGGPLWKRKSPLASRGMINHGSINSRGQKIPSILWFESRWDKRIDFFTLFRNWISVSKPEIGMLHVFTDEEKGSLCSDAGSSFKAGSFGGPAKPGIPNIGWAMAYGGEYLTEVNVENIKAAGFPIDRHGDTMIVRVTENLDDVVNDFRLFATRRAELKRLFKPGLFWTGD